MNDKLLFAILGLVFGFIFVTWLSTADAAPRAVDTATLCVSPNTCVTVQPPQSNRDVTFTWKPSQGATYYRVIFKNEAGKEFAKRVNAPKATLKVLNIGKVYDFKQHEMLCAFVVAGDATGRSPRSKKMCVNLGVNK